jgi:hypothetical protein
MVGAGGKSFAIVVTVLRESGLPVGAQVYGDSIAIG